MLNRTPSILFGLLIALTFLSPLKGQAVANGTYEISAQSSALSIAVDTLVNPNVVDQETYAATVAQKWTITNLGNNIVSIISVGTNQALEVPASPELGVDLDEAPYTGAANQQWTIVTVGGGFFEIINATTGYEANVASNSTSAGTPLCLWYSGNYPNGVWSFTAVSPGQIGTNALTFNLQTMASGANSDAFNDHTTAAAFDSVAIGRFNIGGSATGGNTSWVSTDPLLEAGNGTDANHLSDAFILYKNGDAVFEGSVQAAPSGDIPMYTGN